MYDIIIPVHGNANWTKLCLLAQREHTKAPYRVFIVDNASTDPETIELLKRLENTWHDEIFGEIHVVRLARNKSFSEAINAGMQASKDAHAGTHVVILNNDAIVTPGWDACFTQDLADPKVAITGAQSNVASGLQGMGGLARVLPAKYLVFLAVAALRSTWEEIGPLDAETFPWFGGEDVDYSFRARFKRAVGPDGLPRPDEHTPTGRRLHVSDAFVLHAGSQTIFSTLKSQAAADANNKRAMDAVCDKWGRAWTSQQVKIKPSVALATLSRTHEVPFEFVKSLMGLRMEGGFDTVYLHQTRQHTHMAREQLARAALDAQLDYILFVDDDMTFQPDLLKRLMAWDKDIVTAVAYQRKEPYGICVFGWEDTKDVETPCDGCGGGKVVTGVKVEVKPDNSVDTAGTLGGVLPVTCAKCAGKGTVKRVGMPQGGPALEGIENTGLKRIGWAGCAAVLIKTSVFAALDKHPDTREKPWWAHDAAQEDTWARFREAVRGTPELSELGLDTEANRERLFKLVEQGNAGNPFFGRAPVGEDFWFYRQARLAGIEAYCDTSVVVGHLADPPVVDAQTKAAWRARGGR